MYILTRNIFSLFLYFFFLGKSAMNADKTEEPASVAVDVAGIKDKKEEN